MLSLIKHYAHAIEFRADLLCEISRASSRGIAVPKWLRRLVLVRPGAAEDWVHFLRFVQASDKICLIDVGANVGYFAEDFLRLFPNTKVIAIEPIPATAQTLAKRFKDNRCVSVINAAVSPERGPLQMTAAAESSLSSIHSYASFLNRPDVEGSSVSVETIRLDDLILPEDERLLVLKVDVQGHEAPALSTGPNLLNKVSIAIVEVSFIEEYVGVPPSFGECTSLLRRADLHPVIFQDFGVEYGPYAFERDVLFVKSRLLSQILGH